jgi:hypothetical protein
MEQKRKTMGPAAKTAPKADEELDDDDCFHETMKAFVDMNNDWAQKLATCCFGVFRLYKELSFFFDDFGSVYPPPRDDKSTKVELISVFHSFAMNVRGHREEIRQDQLRDLCTAAPSTDASAINDEGKVGTEVGSTKCQSRGDCPILSNFPAPALEADVTLKEDAYMFAMRTTAEDVEALTKLHGDNFSSLGHRAEQWICEGILPSWSIDERHQIVEQIKAQTEPDESKFHACCLKFKEYIDRWQQTGTA